MARDNPIPTPKNMLKINFKEGDQVCLTRPIQDFIKSSQNLDLDEKQRADLACLDSLRADALAADGTEASIKRLQTYYAQLCVLGGKLPFDENFCRVGFRWYSSFEKGRKKPATALSLEFEKANVLFNIGAANNQMGWSNFTKTSAESLKRGAFFFQNSAGCFQEILDKFATELARSVVSAELSPASLRALISLNLALAQECFYHKAVLDKMKDGTVSKIASKCAELYSSCFEQAGTDSAKQVFHSEWLLPIQSRSQYFGAMGQLYKSKDCEAAGKYGESIARLRLAESHMKKAHDLVKALSTAGEVAEMKSQLEQLQVALKKAEKDNDVIYLEPVPGAISLAPLDKVQLAQVTPLPSFETFLLGTTPILQTLYPFHVHQQLTAYNDRKVNLIRAQADRLTKATTDCNDALKGMGLPGALTALEQPSGLPADLLQKSEFVRREGGAQSLYSFMQTLTNMASSNSALVEEVRKILTEEANEDSECRRAFGDRWKRTPSSELQRTLLEKLGKYSQKFDLAKESDKAISAKFQNAIAFISSLSSSKEDLEASIPSSTQASVDSLRDPTVVALKAALSQLDDVKRSRETIMDSFKTKAASETIVANLLEASAKNDTNFEAVYEKNLSKFSENIAMVDANLVAQFNALKNLVVCFEKFKTGSKWSEALRARQAALQNLESAFIDFKSLHGNFNEGIKFHTDLDAVLKNIRNQAADMATARGIEKKDMLKDITEAVSGSNQPPPLPDRPTQQYSQRPPPATYQQPPPSYVAQSSGSQYYPTPQQQQGPQPGVWTPSVPLAYTSQAAQQSYYPPNPSQQPFQQANPNGAPYQNNPYGYPQQR